MDHPNSAADMLTERSRNTWFLAIEM
jgi:hypothetical protein